MKKLFCILLVMIIALSFAACGKDKDSKVTIYIPDTVTIYQGDTVYASVTYVFEEDWQNKESFTATMTGNAELVGNAGKMVFTDKKLVQMDETGAGLEMRYNELGQEIVMINFHSDGGRYETYYTFDSKGRVATEETKYYSSADAQPVITNKHYTYTDTAEGSVCTQEEDGYTVVITCDKNGRQISNVTSINGQEMSRAETTYDAFGNTSCVVNYYNGQKQTEIKYTWKAVEVSEETANRLPQYKKGN